MGNDNQSVRVLPQGVDSQTILGITGESTLALTLLYMFPSWGCTHSNPKSQFPVVLLMVSEQEVSVPISDSSAGNDHLKKTEK